jgi:curli biogenesis system outer membrane secretion channel CsgG
MRFEGSLRAIAVSALAAAFAIPAFTSANAEDIQQKKERKEAEIPVCSHKIGTLAVYEPENKWWQPLGLESPEALLKVFVQHSHCFTLVDRGKGLAAVQQERELASQGDLQQGSNMGRGQIKAADYVLVPDIVSKNADAGGTNVGGFLGGLVGGGAGVLLSHISINSSTADVVLTVTNVRTSEQVALEEGHGSKSDLGFGVGGAGWWGGGAAGLGVDNYQHTQIGQVVTLAYIDAYTKLVTELGGLSDNASQDDAQQAVSMKRPGRMYTSSSTKSKVVRSLDKGMMLYPTGTKDGVMWEVKDELGNQGWVSSLSFELAK